MCVCAKISRHPFIREASNDTVTSFRLRFKFFFALAADTSLPIREYFHLIDRQRQQKVRKIKELLESIGPILIKLESLILGTFTGESPKMKLCYAYWEKELFGTLIRYDVAIYVISILPSNTINGRW